MPRGGKRAGAGRKSNADIARARGLIGAVIPDTRARLGICSNDLPVIRGWFQPMPPVLKNLIIPVFKTLSHGNSREKFAT